MSKTKVNIFQRGKLQRVIAYAVSFISIGIVAFIFNWPIKWYIMSLVKELENNNVLAPEASIAFQIFLDQRFGQVAFSVLSFTLISIIIGKHVFLWMTKKKLVLPATLPKAVEFRSAMRKLGIASPEEEIAFVKKHKISVFIAQKPLISHEQEAVRAQL